MAVRVARRGTVPIVATVNVFVCLLSAITRVAASVDRNANTLSSTRIESTLVVADGAATAGGAWFSPPSEAIAVVQVDIMLVNEYSHIYRESEKIVPVDFLLVSLTKSYSACN